MLRKARIDEIAAEFRVHPVVALIGPRQCGKTTLARQYIQQAAYREHHFFDLEDADDLAALQRPKLVFENLQGLIVIDEVQRRPELFTYLRTFVDKTNRKVKILILGSASRDLLQQSNESLAGRIGYIELTPFALNELEAKSLSQLWLRGGYPPSFLADQEGDSLKWRNSYISTFLGQDLPALGLRIPAPSMMRFWQMLTHYQGQEVNFSELGRSFSASDTTTRHYVDILSETFIIRQLQPWYENLKKRQVKRPKLYFRDSGLYHAMCRVENWRSLLSHPKLGASWEAFALEQVIQTWGLKNNEVYFWGVHSQGELDLFFQHGGYRYGVEFKNSGTPQLTKSMHYALQHLKLDFLYCIHAGDKNFSLHPKVQACALNQLPAKVYIP